MDRKQFYYDLWDAYLPPDAHERCSGRLFISVTRFPSLTNALVSQFESREKLIWTIVASICLPICFIKDFPVFIPAGHRKGEQQGPGGVGTDEQLELGNCIDGGVSNDAPCLDSYTITVSAMHQKADVRPSLALDGAAKDRPRTATEGEEEDDGGGEEEPEKEKRKGHQHQHQHQGGGGGIVRRLSFLDIFVTPSFERVWEVAALGERSAARCDDFLRPEWASQMKKPSKF